MCVCLCVVCMWYNIIILYYVGVGMVWMYIQCVYMCTYNRNQPCILFKASLRLGIVHLKTHCSDQRTANGIDNENIKLYFHSIFQINMFRLS